MKETPRRPGPRLTPAQREELLWRWDKGEPVAAIARRLGVTPQHVIRAGRRQDQDRQQEPSSDV